MADRRETPPLPLGIYGIPPKQRVRAIDVIAVLFSLLWLIASASFFLMTEFDFDVVSAGSPLWFVMVMLAVFMPVAVIWVAITAMRSSRIVREESHRLQVSISAMRHAYVTQNQDRNAVSEPSVVRKLEEIAAAQRKTEAALAVFAAAQEVVAPPMLTHTSEAKPDVSDDQASLPFGTQIEDLQPPMDKADFIRALNFPETADDKEGFAALRQALRDRSAGQLVRAAQDILTLMSQDGIYMDDLRPEFAHPDVWRQFAAGERGPSIASLGGIKDRSSLALTSSRMKSDPVFRDTAHHFLRVFDRMISDFVGRANDADLTELSNTRSARAFMLLARATGTFD